MYLDPNLAISDTGYLFNPATGDSYSINPTAIVIVQALKNGEKIQAIVAQITKTFEVPTAIAERDVEDFLGYLRQLKMVEDE